ncbi:ACP S-malonyltransferase [Pelagibacteraceae bacterium]|nr:ACP S-malonyltransferase [Pelagibacteraceae bacterium]
MKALLFPGQGSQIVGMGLEFYNNFEIVKKIFSEADDRLNFKISKIILEGPDSDLKLTKFTQPAILTVSYSIFSVLKKEFGLKLDDFKYFAGHSLGEYSALVCSESLNFTDGVYLLHERGKFMQESVPVGEGGMLAILGTEASVVEGLISEIKNKEICEIANDNANGQLIVSGNINSIKLLQSLIKKNNKKSILLPVSAPFHCSLMKPAAEKMKFKIDETSFKNPTIEIINNVTALPISTNENIKKLLIEQIYSKVRWREIILFMEKNKVKEYIEIGPGKVLTGLVKRIVKNNVSNSINSLEDIKKII